MSDPIFSVIIPAYNAEATLCATVASVLNQSERNIEVIIIDDGSTDRTLHAVLELGCRDMRIRAVSQPNSGVSAARNYGASLARGRYLAFLDADDQWHPNKLETHLKLHETNAAIGASFAEVQFCSASRGRLAAGRSVSRVAKGMELAKHNIADVVIENPVCTTSNLVITREAFAASGGFKDSLRYAEDQELLARLIGRGVSIRGIDIPLVKYRMSEDGLSCDFEAMLAGWRSFASEWLEGEDLARAEATYCRYLARRALRAGAAMSTVRSYVRRGLATDRPAFMAARLRSILTVFGAFAGGMMPAPIRRTVFA